MEKYIKLLQSIIIEIAKEINNIDSVWSKEYRDIIMQVVEPEINKLLGYAKNGEVYFKYGKKQRMLESTYCIIDNILLGKTVLGNKILELQEIYNKL